MLTNMQFVMITVASKQWINKKHDMCAVRSKMLQRIPSVAWLLSVAPEGFWRDLVAMVDRGWPWKKNLWLNDYDSVKA